MKFSLSLLLLPVTGPGSVKAKDKEPFNPYLSS